MRLPEALDCESIGHSIGLNDEQILELSKLDKGVRLFFKMIGSNCFDKD